MYDSRHFFLVFFFLQKGKEKKFETKQKLLSLSLSLSHINSARTCVCVCGCLLEWVDEGEGGEDCNQAAQSQFEEESVRANISPRVKGRPFSGSLSIWWQKAEATAAAAAAG
jgi:hypothetical protein